MFLTRMFSVYSTVSALENVCLICELPVGINSSCKPENSIYFSLLYFTEDVATLIYKIVLFSGIKKEKLVLMDF